MALVKKTYRDGESIIYAADMNAMQDEIIANGTGIGQLNTNKQNKIAVSGILKGNGSGGVSSAAAGTDYLAPSALQPYRTASAQDVIDNVQNEQISDLEQATTATTIDPVPLATFDASAADMPLKELTVDIEPVQEGSGDPSPENVRPITGWTGCNVTRTGKNLLKYPYYDASSTVNGITFTVNDDGSVTVNGTSTATADFYFFKSERPLPLPNGSYLLSSTYNGQLPDNGFYIHAKANQADSSFLNISIGNEGTYTITNGVFYTACIRVLSGYTINNVTVYPIIRLASEADNAFEPYKGTTYDITFHDSAGTVYGGTIDVVNKKLTVDRGEVEITENTALTNFVANQTYGAAACIEIPEAYCKNDETTVISEIAESTSYTLRSQASDRYRVYAYLSTYNNHQIYLRGSNLETIDTVEQLRAKYLNTKIVYKLENPLVYDLSDVPEITTLLGTNNIWADCGDVSVTYGAYLETLKASLDSTNGELDTLRACIAPIEDGDTANQAYAAGAYFFRNGSFCTALAAIDSGAAFTLGTNYQVTTVAAVLIALQS